MSSSLILASHFDTSFTVHFTYFGSGGGLSAFAAVLTELDFAVMDFSDDFDSFGRIVELFINYLYIFRCYLVGGVRFLN